MSNEQVIDRIRKLLALASNNTNVAEAATAAALAQDLLFKHKLSVASVEATGGGRDEEPIGAFNVDEETGLQLRWKSDLICILARAFFCRPIIIGTRIVNEKKVQRVQVIGKTSDTQTVAYMSEYLRREIERLAKEQCTGKGFAYANSFRRGAVIEISARLSVQKKAQTPVDQTALVVMKRDTEEVDATFKRLHPKTTLTRDTGISRGDGFSAGRAAGATIGLGGGRGLGAAPKQIGGKS